MGRQATFNQVVSRLTTLVVRSYTVAGQLYWQYAGARLADEPFEGSRRRGTESRGEHEDSGTQRTGAGHAPDAAG